MILKIVNSFRTSVAQISVSAISRLTVSGGYSPLPPPEKSLFIVKLGLGFCTSYESSISAPIFRVSGGYSPLPPEKALMIVKPTVTSLVALKNDDDESQLKEKMKLFKNYEEQKSSNSRYLLSVLTKSMFGGFTTLPLLTRPPLPAGVKHYTKLSKTIPTQGYLIHELAMEACAGDRLLNGKGLWTGYVVKNHVSNLRRYFKSNESKTKVAVSIARQEILNLSSEDKNLFATVWKNLENPKNNWGYWEYEAATHSYYSLTDHVDNYIYKTGHLFVRFLGGGREDITNILKELGYRPGFFYEAKKFKDRVSEQLEVIVYPAFRLEDDFPCFDYFLIALDLKDKVVSHPTAALLDRGMFLFKKW